MLINKIISELRASLPANPTDSQNRLLKHLAIFTIEGDEGGVLMVKGYAGTGKTTTLSTYVKVLGKYGFKVVLLAPTGRAAKVFSSYSNHSAYTIHKKIYRQKSSKDGFGRFDLEINLHTRTIFIVDEASMISNKKSEGNIFGSGYLLNDLLTYVDSGKDCKLILMGDVAQLPPVGLNISPALDADNIILSSKIFYQTELVDVVRQSEDSGILINATALREKLAEGNINAPLLKCDNYDDIILVSGNDLTEFLSDSYYKTGIDGTLVICRSNKRANKFNQGIRNQILGREEELSAGDLLMVVKNNYFWLSEFQEADFIANGDIIEILKIHSFKELYGCRFCDCTIRLVDYDIELEVKLLLDTLHTETASQGPDENRKLFYNVLEDYSEVKPKRKQYQSVKDNPFFNALQVKYAYAVTCHKAQGGQWREVYIDAGYLTKEMIDSDYIRWLYTALTRTTGKVYLVNFPDFLLE